MHKDIIGAAYQNAQIYVGALHLTNHMNLNIKPISALGYHS